MIENGQEYFVISRLGSLAEQKGYAELSPYIRMLMGQSMTDVHVEAIENLTNNETSFFRDGHPFKIIQERILPELIAKRRKMEHINIWCAACSSGQESYSMAMIIQEYFKGVLKWDSKIIASDLCQRMLVRAKGGVYSQFHVNRGLPARYLLKYFSKEGVSWRLNSEIRNMVDFKQINLTDKLDKWPDMPAMDIVLLRNVFIYMNAAVKNDILTKISQILKPDGYLILGAAETIPQSNPYFQLKNYERTLCYQLFERSNDG